MILLQRCVIITLICPIEVGILWRGHPYAFFYATIMTPKPLNALVRIMLNISFVILAYLG